MKSNIDSLHINATHIRNPFTDPLPPIERGSFNDDGSGKIFHARYSQPDVETARVWMERALVPVIAH